jgi:hypothetical protein
MRVFFIKTRLIWLEAKYSQVRISEVCEAIDLFGFGECA